MNKENVSATKATDDDQLDFLGENIPQSVLDKMDDYLTECE